MKTLQERIKKHRKDFESSVRRETVGEGVAKRLGFIEQTKTIFASQFSSSVDVVLVADDFEMAELTMIPRISGMLGVKWVKKVHEHGVSYLTRYNPLKFMVATISVLVDEAALKKDECKIIPVNTGRTVDETKIITHRMPEVIYVTECSEGNNGEEG